MRTLTKAILPLCLLLTFAGAAAAQTPDGSPPSEEMICDGQTGAAYGLCTAYCEAMDCDSESPNANAHACEKVAANYTRITGETLPCSLTCPCWEEADLQSVTAANQLNPGLNSCVFTNGVAAIRNVPGSTPDVEGGFSVGSDPISGVCFTRDRPLALSITRAEAAACRQQIFSRCEAIGTPIP